MPTNAPQTLNVLDVFYLMPVIALTVWGLVVLLVDQFLARRMVAEARQKAIARLSLVGVAVAMAAALAVCLVPLYAQQYPEETVKTLAGLYSHTVSSNVTKDVAEAQALAFGNSAAEHLADTDPTVFFGTIAGDPQVAYFNVLYIFLLGLVVYLSTAWSFTEDWGEYFALLFWATVGMMLLTAAEELVTLFLTLETMTICLYLSTAMEKSRRRSVEGGLKYFIYGSVSSALFLFGLSLLYGLTGTTQLGAIRHELALAPGVGFSGLSGNLAGALAVLLMLVGFGFKVSAVPFHQWAPDAYEGAPAAVTAWIATGSKIASFVALMKVLLHALLPWSNPPFHIMGPGWLGIIVVLSAVTMTYGNFAALAQRNFKRMLAYSSIAHAGYLLVGVAAASVSVAGPQAAGAVLFYLVVYAFSNVGAFAAAAWLVRDKKTDDIEDLNGLGFQDPLLATCILVLMLSLIGIPPLGGFFGKLYVFMEALNAPAASSSVEPVALMWLVALGLFNSVVSAFYYVRVLKAMFLVEPGPRRLQPASNAIALPIVIGTLVVVLFGVMPGWLMVPMRAASLTMLIGTFDAPALTTPAIAPGAKAAAPPAPAIDPKAYEQMMMRGRQNQPGGGPAMGGGGGGPAMGGGGGAHGKAVRGGARGKAFPGRAPGPGGPDGGGARGTAAPQSNAPAPSGGASAKPGPGTRPAPAPSAAPKAPTQEKGQP